MLTIRQVILGTARLPIIARSGTEYRIRALCDNGSQVNLISNQIALKLGLTTSISRTTFLGIGGTNLGASLGKVQARIKLRNGQLITDNFYIVKTITSYAPRPTNQTFQWKIPLEELADDQFDQPGRIDALLGVGIWIQIIEAGIIKASNNQVVAQKTKLGYVIFGNEADPYKNQDPYIGAISKGPSIKELTDTIQRLWEIEELPQEKLLTKEEKACEEIFAKTHSRDPTGRYIVQIPFNDRIRELGKSKNMALHQFFAMEGRMKKNAEFASKYKIFMTEYEALGHMTQIRDEEQSGYYTPHHGVLSSNKFRVVFNASAKTTSNISLNEAQMVGEKLQNDLFVILINFRQFKYGITADIEKMYRQILIHPDDRKYQKILWRSTPQEPIRTFQLNTVTYGHACAPHCAIRTLVQCATDHEQQFPLGAKLLRNCFYVDDLLTGAHNAQEAQEIKTELTSLLEKGQFKITKWKTNGRFCEKIQLGNNEAEEQPSVLGLCWDLSKDTFIYKLREGKDEGEKNYQWTKRRILSKIARLYDPNGYLGPIIMTGKMIMQDLWKDNLDWDEKISGPIQRKWKTFNEDLQNIRDISINRWIGLTKGQKMQLHGFCDASEKGYGAVVYSRVQENQQYRMEIIASKSRVAPLKVNTIPRLELCAASLLVNLMKVVITTLRDITGQVFCWTDSQIVLHWLTKPSTTLKTYVANRVANIQTKNEIFNLQWKWVAGQDNPADLISRGTNSSELKTEEKWWHGPKWIKDEESTWPPQPVETIRDLTNQGIQSETKTVHLTTSPIESGLTKGKWFKCDTEKQKTFPLLQAYGEWEKLLGVTAMLFRAATNFRHPRERETGNLTKGNYEVATKFLIQLDQKSTLAREIKAAKVRKQTNISTLTVVWDDNMQFLRVDGRIQSINLTRDEQYPIVLAKNSDIAPLLIRDAHKKTGHGGNQLVLQYLRKKYWIIGARGLTKNSIRQCPTCFKQRMKTAEQLMASLPTSRTTPSRPFSRVGVDYAGPVIVRSHLGRAPQLTKVWIAVFICLVTRAIHLELVSNASTEAFIAALKRIIARRGMITEIISDNGTNFVGANNFLQEIEQTELRNQTERKFHIKWKFTTPGAPHQGGIYEAAVKSVKHHLIRIIGDTTLTFEEYSTILCQVEAYVNSRPINAITDDPTDLNALTPGHFLIGEPLVKIPDEDDFRETPVNRLKRWEHLQQMQQHFWQRWHQEYLSTLINRPKWRQEKDNLKEGDLVVVRDENIAPMKWKMARVQEVLPGKDGLIRSVVIRTADGVYKRPITKLGLLYSAIETRELEQ